MKLNQMFPVRLLGFGLYWAWLFLVTVSPSPAFGVVECLGLPFELVELAMRLAFVCLFFFLWGILGLAWGGWGPISRAVTHLDSCSQAPWFAV